MQCVRPDWVSTRGEKAPKGCIYNADGRRSSASSRPPAGVSRYAVQEEDRATSAKGHRMRVCTYAVAYVRDARGGSNFNYLYERYRGDVDYVKGLDLQLDGGMFAAARTAQKIR